MADPQKKDEPKVRRPKALKRDLQNKKRRLQNRSEKSRIKTAMREFDELKAKGDEAKIKESLQLLYSLLDKSVKKGVYTLNKASRTKSRLTARAHATA
jgi:small subunit ribosomal protein S20